MVELYNEKKFVQQFYVNQNNFLLSKKIKLFVLKLKGLVTNGHWNDPFK